MGSKVSAIQSQCHSRNAFGGNQISNDPRQKISGMTSSTRSYKKIYDAVIIGAGFAGLSTAYHLAKKGLQNILVIEHEKKLGGHASGRNAGMIRQAISDPVLAALAVEGQKRLSQCGKLGWKGADLCSHGSLLLAKGKEIDELKRTAQTLKKEKLSHRWFSRDMAAERVPLLKGGDFEIGLYCGSDGMVDIKALLDGFYKEVKRFGVPVLLGHSLEGIQAVEYGFRIRAGNKIIFANKIVNAAGAWAGAVARKAKASSVPLKAYRRHLFISKRLKGSNKSWPFVWDLSHNFYFRPRGKALLLSPCDKGEVGSLEKAARKEAVDRKMEKLLHKKLEKFSSGLKSIHIQNAKSGLRTMTPDARFVVGEDPKLRGFFWVAGLGGHGVTTSFSVGDLASDLILGKKREKHLVDALSPRRFVKQ